MSLLVHLGRAALAGLADTVRGEVVLNEPLVRVSTLLGALRAGWRA